MFTFPVGFFNLIASGGGGGTTDPFAANVVLFLKGDGTNGSTSIIDSSPSPKIISAYGNTQLESDVTAYNNSAIRVDGSGDYFELPNNSDLSFPTSTDFTVEFIIKFYALPTSRQMLFARWGESSPSTLALDCLSGNIRITTWDDLLLSVAHGFTANTRYHVAISRVGSNLRLFIAGNLVATYTGSLGNFTNINTWEWGGFTYLNLGFWVNANYDVIRMTKNVGRYTANFNPETDTYLNP